jgi:hypothetical protein
MVKFSLVTMTTSTRPALTSSGTASPDSARTRIYGKLPMPADLPKTHLMLGAAKQQLSSRFDAGQGGLPV